MLTSRLLLIFTVVSTAVVAHADSQQVPRFVFAGNHALSNDDLHGAIALAPQDASMSIDSAIRQDVLAVLGAYYDHGYADAHVDALKLDSASNTVTLLIREGPLFTISEVHVTGDLLGDEQDELARLTSHPAVALSRINLMRDCEALSEAYEDEGYAFVDILPLAKLDFARSSVGLKFEIVRGPRVTIDTTRIIGNHSVSEAEIRRQLAISAGDRFSISRLLTSKRRLLALPAVKDVMVAVEHGPTPDRAVVVFEIVEMPTSQM